MRADWVVPEPKNFERGAFFQVLYLAEFGDIVFAQVQLSKLFAGCEVTQAFDLIHAERSSFDLRHVF